MIKSAVAIVPVSKLSVVSEALGSLGFSLAWEHDPGKGELYGEFTHPDGISFHASESRGDGTGPVCIYFYVEDIDSLAASAGLSAEDMPWFMREFHVVDADGNQYRFGQALAD